MSRQLKKTAKNSAIYAIGTILRRVTALVMLPIYTRYLTPSDYGVVELLTMAIEFASILAGIRISQAMFRYYLLAESNEEKQAVVSTVLIVVTLSSLLGAVVMFFAAVPITQFIFGSTDYVFEFQLFAFTLVSNAISAVGLSYLRARQMPILFVTIGAATLAIQVSLNIIFVVVLEMHVTGVVYSALISGVIVAVGLSVFILWEVGVNYSRVITIKLVKYVAPLILASIGAFYVAFADKYFIRLFGSLADVGLYALAARVSSIIATVYEAFNMSWGADRFEVVKKENANYVFEQVFRFMSVGIILSSAGLALFAGDFFRVMTSPEYYTAGYIVPLLVLASMARIYTIFCNFGALYRDSTSIMAEAAWLKAVIATIGYLSLIPVMGFYGAALILALANLVELIWVYKKSTRLYDMGINWSPVIGMLAISAVLVTCGLLLPEGELVYFLLRVVLFAALVLMFYVLPWWQPDERLMMKLMLRKLARLPGGK